MLLAGDAFCCLEDLVMPTMLEAQEASSDDFIFSCCHARVVFFAKVGLLVQYPSGGEQTLKAL